MKTVSLDCPSTMKQTNLLREAVEKRKQQLIRLLIAHQVLNDTDRLAQWTLSELEHEWKRYQKQKNKDIG